MGHVFAMSSNLQELNKAIQILSTLDNLKMVKQTRKSRGDNIKVICDWEFSNGFMAALKEMIKKDGEVCNNNKVQPITNNKYCMRFFENYFQETSQNEKDQLFDYGIGTTSYDMLLFLVKLGAQINMPDLFVNSRAIALYPISVR